MSDPDASDAPVVAFVCVRNAGRSQMAAAFAEREAVVRRQPRSGEQRSRERRGADVEILTGGTDPAEHVHDVVVEAMAEAGFDLSAREPRKITPADIDRADYVITMGCSADDVCPATWRGDARDWALDDPHGRPLAEVREIRDEIRDQVVGLFEELADEHQPGGDDPGRDR